MAKFPLLADHWFRHRWVRGSMLLSSAHSYNTTGSLVSVVNNRFALDTSNYNYWVYNSQPFVSTAYTVDS